MQVITTKFLPVTNTKPNRIKATCAAGSRTITVDNAHEKSHHAAARALCDKLGWPYHSVAGQDHKGDYQHVLLHSHTAEYRETPDSHRFPTQKYRPWEIEKISDSMRRVRAAGCDVDDYPARLQLTHSGPDHSAQTRYLSLDAVDVAALLDLFNQID